MLNIPDNRPLLSSVSLKSPDVMSKLLFLIFIVSGFSGLIYESIWSHYLKLFLGHAAYSQALVLCIFMGGMALGAWLASLFTKRNINLLLAYALVEFLIGIFGIIFHQLYVALTTVSFEQLIPAIGIPWLIQIYKWSLGGLIIFPQSVLLGMTFPLMTNGILRISPQFPGKTISRFYFGNSIGAAAGVLFSGFYLIPQTGLPGTIMFAGILNILVALSVYLLCRQALPINTVSPVSPDEKTSLPVLFLFASFATGMASFIYEIIWIRMLSMVLGSSTHAFELMLSAFITGLALGALWIRHRIDRVNNAGIYAGYIQILMALSALLTIALYNQTFDLMAIIINGLTRNLSGYYLFNLGSQFLAMLIMVPTTILAGMTLPLFTLLLLRQDYGERSIGHIYTSNTLGAISGVLIALFIGFPYLGIKGSIILGSGIDLLTGLLLIAILTGYTGRRIVMITSIGLYMVISIVFRPDPMRMSSNVYRSGQSRQPDTVLIPFHVDGKTATVSVLKYPSGYQSILTNGKPDASVFMGSGQDPKLLYRTDEITQVLLAVIPLALLPGAKQSAVIGMGSGMTTQTLLQWPELDRVDTVEIEGKMIEGARLFRPRNNRVFTDPRSFIHIEDAKTFFSLRQNHYDIIVSEPSNPWVSGVSNLYTREFYHQVKRSINKNGLFIQWLHLYEFNDRLLFTILKAMAVEFNDFRIYTSNGSDIIIAASPHSSVPDIRSSIFSNPGLSQAMQRVSIKDMADIEIRYLANKQFLLPYIINKNVLINSDYFPVVDLYSPRARFMQETVTFLLDMRELSPPLPDVYRGVGRSYNATAVSEYPVVEYIQKTNIAAKILAYIDSSGEKNRDLFSNENRAKLDHLINTASNCDQVIDNKIWIDSFLQLMNSTMPYLDHDEMKQLFENITPHCQNGSSQMIIHWLDQASAYTAGNFQQVLNISNLLMNKTVLAETDPHIREYLLRSKMIALFALQQTHQLIKFVRDEILPFYADQPLPDDLQWLLLNITAQQNNQGQL